MEWRGGTPSEKCHLRELRKGATWREGPSGERRHPREPRERSSRAENITQPEVKTSSESTPHGLQGQESTLDGLQLEQQIDRGGKCLKREIKTLGLQLSAVFVFGSYFRMRAENTERSAHNYGPNKLKFLVHFCKSLSNSSVSSSV